MCRLDAGTFGTMGVGLGFAIAAATMEKSRKDKGQRIVCVEGDSAFGFSGMEVETMCRWAVVSFSTQCLVQHLTVSKFRIIPFFNRYNLPVVIIVVNNNGIYSGVDADTWKAMANMGDLTSV